MQVQSRYLSSRRADLLSACTFSSSTAGGSHHFVSTVPGSARRVGLFPIGNDANRSANSAATEPTRGHRRTRPRDKEFVGHATKRCRLYLLMKT
ncbi:hypothetical protein niasHS_016215 [Heterodera schachtii]|uniref:Uncharacterized protein n=1 Tax=Heterodera schachtii TaxID=97005 RepID=A0ABD2HQ73_HETSC